MKTYDRYITYESAASLLGVHVSDIELFVAFTGFPTERGKYNMIHDSILNRYRR